MSKPRGYLQAIVLNGVQVGQRAFHTEQLQQQFIDGEVATYLVPQE